MSKTFVVIRRSVSLGPDLSLMSCVEVTNDDNDSQQYSLTKLPRSLRTGNDVPLRTTKSRYVF